MAEKEVEIRKMAGVAYGPAVGVPESRPTIGEADRARLEWIRKQNETAHDGPTLLVEDIETHERWKHACDYFPPPHERFLVVRSPFKSKESFPVKVRIIRGEGE